jgi:methylenetetrahydrofolate dehydrogenase (NADP+) / methenyltetrahydrofolate cyclohydrolase
MEFLSSDPFIGDLHFQLRQRAAALIGRGVEPHLAVVLVGNNPQSLTYTDIKSKRAKEDGIIFSLYHLEEDQEWEEIAQVLRFLAADDEVHGIVLQLPLPERFSTEQVDGLVALIPEEKDVDGLAGGWKQLAYTSSNVADLATYQRAALPPMVLAVLSLLNHYKLDVEGKKIIIVGRGRLVGAPLEAFFHKLGLDVTSVDEHTDNVLSITKEADILITGTGQPDLVTYQWVKPGAVVVDCAQDVHADSVSQVAAALTPAKGGVGPLTVLWLLNNVLNTAEVVRV